MDSFMVKKESKGRQKIKMARIKNPSHRQVTFSKRRLGLFKKASEICTLCGVEAIIIVFSPGQKIFSFGQPNVESIINRYLSRNPICPRTTSSGSGSKSDGEGAQQSTTMPELNLQLTKILNLLEVEKTRGEVFNNLKRNPSHWWEAPIDKLGLHELEVLRESMEDLNKYIAKQAYIVEKNTPPSSNLRIDGGVGVENDQQHFDIKSIEAKIEGFTTPFQACKINKQNFF